MRPELLPTSSLHALLWHEGSGAEITVSPEEGVGGGCVARPTERGDLQKRRPTIESMELRRSSMDKKRRGGKLTRLQR
jgi:hypothetical protein